MIAAYIMTTRPWTRVLFGGPTKTLHLVIMRVELRNVVTDPIAILTRIDVPRGHIKTRDRAVNLTTGKDRGILMALVTRHHLKIRHWLSVVRRRDLLSMCRMDMSETRMQREQIPQLSRATKRVIAGGHGQETHPKAITTVRDVRKMMFRPKTSVASPKLLTLIGKPLTKPKCRAMANFCSRRW